MSAVAPAACVVHALAHAELAHAELAHAELAHAEFARVVPARGPVHEAVRAFLAHAHEWGSFCVLR